MENFNKQKQQKQLLLPQQQKQQQKQKKQETKEDQRNYGELAPLQPGEDHTSSNRQNND